MERLFEEILPTLKCDTYFAGCNSDRGFVNLFSDFFDEAELSSLYIIKGGPGTGKSTFMRSVAMEAQGRGYPTECFLCGSDPSSLDAVTVRKGDRTVCVIDGTSPHAYDSRFPGAVSRIIDFGTFRRDSLLNENRRRIIDLCEKKKDAFEFAYKYLCALSVIRRDVEAVVSRTADRQKIKAFAHRIVSSLPNSGRGSARVKYRTREGFTMCGGVRIAAPENVRLWSVCGVEGSHVEMLTALSAELFRAGHSHTVFRDCIDPDKISALYIEDQGILISPTSRRIPNCERNINLSRFLSEEKLKDTRAKRRFSEKCMVSLAEGVTVSLKEAFTYHSELEGIYKEAMDFVSLDRYTKELADTILS